MAEFGMTRKSKMTLLVLMAFFVGMIFVSYISYQQILIRSNDNSKILNAYYSANDVGEEIIMTKTNEEILREFAPKYAMASILLNRVYVSKNNFSERDRLILQAVKTQSDVELYITLNFYRFIFSEKQRVATNAWISKLDSDSDKARHLQARFTTLRKVDMELIDKCFSLLYSKFDDTRDIFGEALGLSFTGFLRVAYNEVFDYPYSCRNIE